MAYFDQFYTGSGVTKQPSGSGSSTGSSFFDDFYDDEKRKKKYGEIKVEKSKPVEKIKVDKPAEDTSFLGKVKSTAMSAGKALGNFLYGEPETFMQQKAPKTEKLKQAGFDDKQINKLTIESLQKQKESEDRLLSLKEELAKQRIINSEIGKGAKVDKSQHMSTETFMSKQREIAALEEEVKVYKELTGQASTNKGFIRRMADLMSTPESLITNFVPYVKDAINSEDNKRLRAIENKINADQPLTSEEKAYVKRRDAKVIQAYVDKGWGDTFAEALAPNTAYLIDFALTGGTYSAGKKGVEVLLPQAPKIVTKLAGAIGGSIAQGTTRIPVISSRMSEYMLPEYGLVVGSKGDAVIKKLEEGDSFEKALGKGWARSVFEVAAERSGAIIDDSASFLKKALLSKFGVINNIKSPQALAKIAEATGWNGIVSEVFEEYADKLGDLLVDNKPFELPDPTRAIGRKDLETMYPQIFTPRALDEFFLTVGVVGLQGGIMKAADTTLNKALSTKERGDRPVIDISIKEEAKDDKGQEKPKTTMPSILTGEFEKRQGLSLLVESLMNDKEKQAAEMITADASPEEIMKEVGDNAYGMADKALQGEQGSISYLLDTYAKTSDTEVKAKVKESLDAYFKDNPKSDQFDMYKEVIGESNIPKPEVTKDIQAEIKAIQQGKSDIAEIVKEGEQMPTDKGEIVQESTTLLDQGATKTKAIKNLEATDIAINDESISVETIKNYIVQKESESGKFITKEAVEKLRGLGVDELEFDKDGKITLYREGPVTVGEPNSFSWIKTSDNQKEYKLSKDEIAVNIDSKAMLDKFSETYKNNKKTLDANIKALEHWQDVDHEVIVVPNTEARPVSEEDVATKKQESLLRNAKRGEGKYEYGDVYFQRIAGGIRGVIVESKEENGTVNGYYLPKPSSSKLLGSDVYLEPATFTKPDKELEIYPKTNTTEKIRELINQRFFGETKENTIMVDEAPKGGGVEEDEKKKPKRKELKEGPKETIIETNETRSTETNQLIGQQGVSDTEKLGTAATGDTSGDTGVSGEEVARRGSELSSSSTGSRPTARTIDEIVSQYASVDKATGEVSIDYNIDEEQAKILRQYTPAGGMEKKGAEGRGLLDEYYTPNGVVAAMWEIVKKYVTLNENVRVLEPSAGIGRFIDSVSGVTDVDALEINEKTAIIAKLLHPDVQVWNKQFETLFISERGNQKDIKETYDVVIGNPPYGEHRGRYLGLGEEAKIKKYEEYFIKRSLDITKPDGIVAMLVPSGILRTSLSTSKEKIAALGELVLAYRFPNGIFDKTEIGTDLLVFKKNTTADDKEIYKRANKMSNDNYFVANMGNILGEQVKKMGKFGEESIVEGSLDEALDRLSRLQNIETVIPEAEISEASVVSNGSNPPVETFTNEANVEAKPRAEVAPEIQREVDKKVTVKSEKKDKQVNISSEGVDVKEQIEMWQNTDALGRLSKEYVKSLGVTRADQFVSSTISVDFEDNNPVYYSNFMYEQGNIYEKLDSLEINKGRLLEEQYKRQKDALMAILPKPMTVSEVAFQPTSDFVDGIKYEISGEPTPIKNLFSRWMRSLPRDVFEDSGSWEVEGYIEGSIVNSGDKVRNAEVRKRRRRVGNKLFQRFIENELTPDQKRTLEDKYNRAFNSFVRPDYTKVPLFAKVNSTFKGRPLSIKPIQREGAAFLTTKGVGLLAYDVGVGKTLTAILAMNESMHRGMTKRPLLVVPNGVYLNWIKEIKEIIPNVKINLLANLGGKFKGDLSKFKVEDGTISIMTYDGLTKLGFKQETYDKLLTDLKDTISGVGKMTERQKELEKAKADEYIGKAMKKTTDLVNFEDLNFDHVTIDEVHNFKNIFVGAKIEKGKGNEFRNVHGSSSARGIKAYLMTQYILSKQEGRNVHLLSATPFTNSPLEIYSVMSLMAKKKLEEAGLKNVNEFMSMFMELKPTLVIKADQTTQEEDVIEKFINVQQLQKVVTEYIDFRTGDEAGVFRPKKIKKTPVLKPTKAQAKMMRLAEELFTKKNDGGVIMGITEMQNITLSPYLSRYARSGTPDTVKPTDSKQQSDLYYIFNNQEKKYQQVSMAVKVDILPWVETFVRKHDGGWSVNEMKTGTLISSGDSKKAAIETAKAVLENKGEETTTEAINKIVKLNGLSPRYTTDTSVGADEVTPSADEAKYVNLSYDYKSFVEDSPKIRATIEMIKQVKKDNKDVGQVIYMPRGVTYFSYIKEYLVKELKYKSEQIGVIQGGMSVDEKSNVQNDFNSGKVKILIGTEAIKEGVNLQENATDLYYLHLPWNPTDILQVEGRIWRQGNKWKNVRIHYPLIENSVDAFIFQKLETKEKRIKNLWSYKGSVVEVGDLDFEEMKMDLISDPVKRVEAEKIFARSQEQQKLAVIKSDLAFLKRITERYSDAQSDLKYANERLEQAKKENDEQDYEFYKKNVTKAKDKIADLDKTLKAMDTSLDQVKVDVLAKEKLLVEQQKTVEGLEQKYAGLLEVAKAKRVADLETLKENNYGSLVDEIRSENETFFTKAEMKAPSGTASKSTYDTSLIPKDKKAEVLVDTGKEDRSDLYEKITLQTIEMPEMVALAKEIAGSYPTIKELKGRSGDFSGKTGIRLDASIFKDTALAARVLAHEMGHLIDFKPEGTLKRGNIIGRIATLHKFLKQSFDDDNGYINNKQIRSELKKLTQKWAPFDENLNDKYTKYRYSSRELYADAISVLFNDPVILKTEAPVFFTALFDRFNKKPDVFRLLQDTYELLNKGEEALLNERNKAIDEMFKKGDDKFIAKSIEEKAQKDNYWFKLKYDMVDRNQKVIDDLARAKKEGKVISDDDNPVYMLEELNYVGGVIKGYITEQIQPIFKKVKEAQIDWGDFGKVLFLERVMRERGELANPLGQTKETAQLQLTKLEADMGPVKFGKMMQYIEQFREAIKSVLDDASRSGFYSEELVKELKANPAYATYQVIDYLDTYVDAKVKKQIGTLKEIANPADSMIQKTVSLLKAIEKNKTKRTLVKFYKDNFASEIVDAKYMWSGKSRVPVDPDDNNLALMTLYEDGKLRGYYVDKYIAETVARTSTGHTNAVLSVLRFFNSKLYRPLFITFNTGFQTFNAVRDFTRFWKNTPNLPLWRAFMRYGQAVKPAFMDAIDQPNDVIKEMEKQKILSVTANDVFAGQTDVDTQIDAIMAKYGTMSKKQKLNIFFPITAVLNLIERTGNFIERLPKVAAYIELNNRLPSHELGSFIRTKAGSPDFLRRGASYAWSNEVFLFSNSIKEGIRADLEVATDPKTRGGFWFKTAMVNILPKFLMFMALQGLLGDALKKMFEKVSEYDMTNYTVIPVGLDETGKLVYVRIPQDETGRFIGSIFWKAMRINNNDRDVLRDVQEIFSIGAGQFPSLSPTIGTGLAIAQFAFGQNPYDFFRNRNVIPDDAFKAGGTYALKPFATWLFEQMGGSVIMKTYVTEQMPSSKSWQQKVLELPILSNVAGRWIKVSDYGQYEKTKAIEMGIEQRKAQESIENKKTIGSAIKEYMSGSKDLYRKKKIEGDLVKEIIGRRPITKEEKAKATNIVKKFRVAVVQGEYDTLVDRFFTAGTNEEKLVYLEKIKETRSEREFAQLITVLKREKLLSADMQKKLRKIK